MLDQFHHSVLSKEMAISNFLLIIYQYDMIETHSNLLDKYSGHRARGLFVVYPMVMLMPFL